MVVVVVVVVVLVVVLVMVGVGDGEDVILMVDCESRESLEELLCLKNEVDV